MSQRLRATAAVVMACLVAAVLWLVVGRSTSRHSPARDTGARTSHVRSKRRTLPPSPAERALGLPAVPRGPVPGYVLIADRNNNRLLLVSPDKRVVWRFPRPGDIRPGQSFRDPDDAFFTPGYRGVSTNEEFNQQIAELSLRRRRIVWAYGRAGVAGSARGELSNPDDAYELPNGQMMVADIQNCRVVRIDRARQIVGEIGSTGRCAHDPPRTLLAPNGATPLPDGGVLVTEIGGYIDRIDAHGRLLWSIRSPTSYPSDAQLLPNGNVLVAGFNTPGRVDILRPDGRVLWTYDPSSGPGALDRPSLAVRWPNGMIAATDDWHHRVVVIDPKTKRIVWQYGHLGVASSASGYLSKPDGLDLLPAPEAARRSTPARQLVVRRVGSLPASASRLTAAVAGNGRIVVAGGLVGGASSDQVLLGTPASLRLAGHLPSPTHDAAAAIVPSGVAIFGGGQASSTSAVTLVDPASGRTRALGRLDEPLSDLGAVTLNGRVYLVGGYTGSRFASAVLRVGRGASTTTVARLPVGLRYAGVATLGGLIYVAGGVTPAGETESVYAVDPARGAVREVARLPSPVAHAPLVAMHGALYLIGGTASSGAAVRTILRVDPATGSVSIVARLPTALHDAAAVPYRQGAVVCGGGTAAVYLLNVRAVKGTMSH